MALLQTAHPSARFPSGPRLLSPIVGQRPDMTPPPEPPRLLLVEEALSRGPLVESLSVHYQVDIAGDGLIAWRLAQRFAPALVIIGVSIVGASSLALIHALRAHEATVMTPIIVLTASANRNLLLRCLTAGANNFLLKPFGQEDLLACVRLELELHAPFARRNGV